MKNSANLPEREVDIPFYDVARANGDVEAEILAALTSTLSDGWFILGPRLSAFETSFADHCGRRHCIGVGNGLDAITLVLQAQGIGEGDEVIVPAQTFIATFLGVSEAGAVPVPADVAPDSGNISPDAVRAALTPRTRAVLPVHLYGRQVAMPALAEIAREHGIALIEDAAQAHGLARVAGAETSEGSLAATYSFYPTKNLGGLGDGGAVVTDDDELAGRLRKLRNYGSREKYVHDAPGTNSRLDELQAAVLSCKLPHLDRWNQRRLEVAARYAAAFAALPPERCRMLSPPGAVSVWHHVILLVDDRDELQRHLSEAGIGTAVHYPIIPTRQKVFAGRFKDLRFPVAEQMAPRLLSLPVGSYLRDDEVDAVAKAIVGYYS
jgi:dTDP-3-amino-3,4,6-trideoxy-alpha-D-glucose transaminase